MTDYDTWREHFNTFNIKFKEFEFNNLSHIETDEGTGYYGFHFSVAFDKEGTFKEYAVYE